MTRPRIRKVTVSKKSNPVKEKLDFLSIRDLAVKEKLLQLRQTRVKFATEYHVNTHGERMDFDHYPHIKDLYNSLSPIIVLQGSVQSFKGQALSAIVHTPQGWKLMGDLEVGDRVSTPDGKNANIEHIQPLGKRELFRFELDDGRTVETTKDHLWKVLRGTKRKSIPKGRKSVQWDVQKRWEILTTSEIMLEMKKGNQRFSIPVPSVPVEKPEEAIPLDPYFIGLMLGDGEIRKSNIRFSTGDVELLKSVNDYVRRFGLELKQDGDSITYFFKNTKESVLRGGPKILKSLFKLLGLLNTYSHTKFIPDVCKNGSVAQRLAVLQGILDTDGAACDHGGVSVRLSSERLIKDIQEVVWSLGGAAKYTKRESYYIKDGKRITCKDCYLLNISMPNPKECFRLKRKRDKLSDRHRRKRTLGPKIVKAEYVKEEESQCIKLNNKEQLYITNDYIVTHNTEWAVIDHLAAAYCGLSIFYVVPKFESRNTIVQNRINRCVKSVDHYKEIVDEGFFDSVAIKSFGRGVVKYVGSNVFADFKEFPADMVYVDEVDECAAKNLIFANDRLKASKYQFKRWIGNPTIRGQGINEKYLDSDQREWHVPCKDCGEYSEMDWFKCVVNEVIDKDGSTVIDYTLRDADWFAGCRRDVKIVCPKCRGELERDSQKGRWVPQNPDSPIEGYHISMLCNPINPVSEMWEEFCKAITDPGLMQKFYNSILGLPYSALGNKITAELLDLCADDELELTVSDNCAFVSGDESKGPCSMGVDVGAAFDVRISEIGLRGNRKCVFIGKMPDVESLHDLIARYNVETCVIDSMPEVMLVQDFQDEAQCDVWLCRYKGEGSDRNVTYDASNMMIHVDRTETLDRSLAQLKRRKNILPVNFREFLGGEYLAEMINPVREVVEDRKGNQKFEWTKCKDHQRHCDAYDMLAAKFMQEMLIEDVTVG